MSNGSPRPKLSKARPYFTIHYTGAGMWLDPDDTMTELRAIQAYAKNAAKPWEYNWVIDGQGHVWEYAGDYVAAHSAGENTEAIGVLLLVGLDQAVPPNVEQPTPAMIQAVQDLRAWLGGREMLAKDHKMLPHQQMPGANTACPGSAVMAVWPALIAQPTPPTPTTPGDDDVQVRLLILTDSDAQFLAQTDSKGQALYVTWAGPGSPTVDSVVAAHRAEANRKGYGKDFDQKGALAGLANCVLVGELPYGDSKHTWTGYEFWKAAGG